jgi:hypothetical protein
MQEDLIIIKSENPLLCGSLDDQNVIKEIEKRENGGRAIPESYVMWNTIDSATLYDEYS